MKKIFIKLQETKVYEWSIKAHIPYLFMAITLYIIKLLMYTISSKINPNGHILEMEIDKHIPFIKYFVIFYLTYYFMPIILLWIVSFKDKNKFYLCIIAIFITCFLSNIVYCIYNVKAVRPDYINPNMSILDIRKFDHIFDYLVAKVYLIDPSGLNCLPSIHSALGVYMMILSISFDKEKRINIFLTIIGVTSSLMCIVSTVFIKQHYFIDTILGVLLAIIVYIIVWFVYKKNSKVDLE